MKLLITASSRGIGFNLAKQLLEAGHEVTITSSNLDNLRKAYEELKDIGKIHYFKANLLSKEDVKLLIKEAWESMGRIEGFIWNAPNIKCEPCMVHEARYTDWEEAALLHLAIPGYITTLLVQAWLEMKIRGVIIYLSSASVLEPMPPLLLADSARAGLVQLAKGVSRTYGRKGIRAYTVLLGSFDTPGARENLKKLAEERGVSFEELWKKEVIERTPLRRTGKWKELGALINFLLSENAEYMLGSTIIFDGAMTHAVNL
ncbi:glucose-1-dehydrogenase [Pyrococcus sp. NA2]|uniref:SDR family oxidoreductase n=1 Tax=Pyrococcus sp. (strain NA2) TaxID=342949 RepID=UPI000209A9CD|nr:SDR family oxidoreductase [Pyrococcus sp. NA2]AEC51325.1 glucose-1-dehydrogenase [Pyrococcus sp. NA2]